MSELGHKNSYIHFTNVPLHWNLDQIQLQLFWTLQSLETILEHFSNKKKKQKEMGITQQ